MQNNGMVNQCTEEFDAQVYSLNWNMSKRNLFLSGSWDDTIKLWDIHRPESQATFAEHTYCVYAANWYVLAAIIVQGSNHDHILMVSPWGCVALMAAALPHAALLAMCTTDHSQPCALHALQVQ